MSGERQEIFPDIVNEVVCQACSRRNKLVVKEDAGRHVAYTCVCGATTWCKLMNRRKSRRQFSNAFGTCWLGDNERGVTIKIANISEDGMQIEFMGRKSELAPKIITTGKGKVIYNEGGQIISQPREIIFKNMNGLKVGAQFAEVEKEDTDARDDGVERGVPGETSRNSGVREEILPEQPPPGPPASKKVRMRCKVCDSEMIECAGFEKPTSIKCHGCGNVFSVKINRRRTPRSSVAFPGRISDLRGETYDIQVQNLSDDGICFSLLDKEADIFNESEHVIVSFNKPDERVSGKAIIISFSGGKRIHARFKIYKS